MSEWKFEVGDELSLKSQRIDTTNKVVTMRLYTESDGERYYCLSIGHASNIYEAEDIEDEYHVC